LKTLVESSAKLRSQGKLEEALLLIENYIKNNGEEYRAKILAAEYSEKLSNFSKATNYYVDSIKANPSDAFNYLNFARFLLRRNEYSKSLENFEKAFAIDQNSPIILTQFGRINLIIGNTNRAEELLESALKIQRDLPQADYLLALTKLKLNKFEEGWSLYNKRQNFLNFKYISLGVINPNVFEFKKKWNGQSLDKKKLVIIPEQGFGDFIMFGRYIKVLKDSYDVDIILLCHPSFVDLFSNCKHINKIFSISSMDFEESNQGFDHWTTIFDLPVFFKNYPLKNFNHPYIYPKKNIKFDNYFSKDSLNLGLCWRSSSTSLNSINKSIPSLSFFSKLFNNKEISLYSLQLNYPEEDKLLFPSNMFDFSGQINNFNDTANIITKLDAVITVDTAVAHLSGATNIPTHLLLPMYESDWRWSENTDKSIWYPSVTIYRLSKDNAWEDLIDSIIVNLGID